MPAYAVTRNPYSVFVQTLVILDNVPIMAGRSGQIETPTGKELMRGTLESCHEETGEERLGGTDRIHFFNSIEGS